MQKADIVIKNAVVFTADGNNSIASTLAIKENIIIYVGDNAEDFISKHTKIIDYNGKTILPGMIDAHMHPMFHYRRMFQMDLLPFFELQALKSYITNYIAEHQDLVGYTGIGYHASLFGKTGPRKEFLDEICSDKPILFQSSEGHAVWANSKALELAGFSEKDDEYGKFVVRDKDNFPTGVLKEAAGAAANMALASIMPEVTEDLYEKALKDLQNRFISQGVTTVADASVREVYANVYSKLAKSGELKFRIRGYWWLSTSSMDTEEYLAKAHRRLVRHKEFECFNFQMNGFKLFVDLVMDEYTSFMQEPYAFDKNYYGHKTWQNEDDLFKIVRVLDELNMQTHYHQTGNAALSYLCDVLEKVEKVNGKRDSRHLVAHVQFVNDEDKIRMAQLGLSAIVAPYWALVERSIYWEKIVPAVGEALASKQYPIQSLLDKGINTAVHSDYFVSEPHWGRCLFGSITRTMPKAFFDMMYGNDSSKTYTIDFEHEMGIDIVGPMPSKLECTTLVDAIRMATINGAKALFMEEEVGSIEVGKRADIVGFSQNIFELDIMELAEIEPEFTMIDGEVLYSCSDLFD